MITVTTPNLSVTLPDRIKPTKALTDLEADCLNRILIARLRHYANKWLAKGMLHIEIQAQLTALAENHSFSEKVEDHDPITLEARRIAREMVIKRLAKEGLTANDETLELHIQAMCKLPQVQDLARTIVETRHKAARDALGIK